MRLYALLKIAANNSRIPRATDTGDFELHRSHDPNLAETFPNIYDAILHGRLVIDKHRQRLPASSMMRLLFPLDGRRVQLLRPRVPRKSSTIKDSSRKCRARSWAAAGLLHKNLGLCVVAVGKLDRRMPVNKSRACPISSTDGETVSRYWLHSIQPAPIRNNNNIVYAFNRAYLTPCADPPSIRIVLRDV